MGKQDYKNQYKITYMLVNKQCRDLEKLNNQLLVSRGFIIVTARNLKEAVTFLSNYLNDNLGKDYKIKIIKAKEFWTNDKQ